MPTGVVHFFDASRLSSASGDATSAVVSFYTAGTSTLANIFSDVNLSIPFQNPFTVANGGILPRVYLLPDTAYRRRIEFADGTVHDEDPIPLGADAASNVYDSIKTDIETIYNNTVAAALTAEDFYPGARSFIPRGLVAVTLTAVGSGGTNGTYLCPLSGDNLSVDAFVQVVVAGGVITSATVSAPGLYIGGSPTAGSVDLSSITGLTSATVTPVIGFLKTSGQYYLTDHATDPKQAALFQNQSNSAVEVIASVGWLNLSAAQASATLAGHYANDATNVDVPGGLSGERGAKYWSNNAKQIVQDTYGEVITGLSQSGWKWVLTGTDGNLLIGLTDDIKPVLVVSSISLTDPTVTATVAANLGSTVVNYYMGTGFSQSGRSMSWQTSDGNELFGVTDDAFPQPTGAMSPFQNERPEFIVGTSYNLLTRRDAKNRMQVWSVNKLAGSVLQLSTSGLDNIQPQIDNIAGKAVWTSSDKDRWPSGQLRSRVLDGSYPVSHGYPDRKLLVTGDSTDNGSGATGGNSQANLLGAATALPVTNLAIGGQQLWQQAMALGAIPIVLTTSSTNITTSLVNISAISSVNPRTGSVVTQTVSSTANLYPNTLFLSTGADNSTRSSAGFITDTAGRRRAVTVTRTAAGGPPSTSETYTITSNEGVTIVVPTTSVTFYPNVGDIWSWCISMGGGLNDLAQGFFSSPSVDPYTILADVRAVQDQMVKAIGPVCPAFVINGMYNQASTFTITGQDADLAIITHNNDRRTKYAGRFVDRFAIFAAGGDGGVNDNSDIANHWVPRSLRGSGDIIHPNNAGHALWANGNSGGAGSIALLSAQLAALPLT